MVGLLLLLGVGRALAQAGDPGAATPAQEPQETPTGAPELPSGAALAPLDVPRDRVQHVPPSQGATGAELVLRAVADQLETGRTLVAWYRTEEQASYRAVPFGRGQDGAWLCRLPTGELPPGRVLYYIEAGAGPSPGPRFGSAERPWAVELVEPPATEREVAELRRLDGQRSRAWAAGAWRPWGDGDATWSALGEFTYRPLGAVRSFRLGIERVRGTTPVDGAPLATGYDRGYSEVEFALRPRWSISPEIDLGAQEEFTAGGGLSTRIGLETGTHARLGVWGLGGVALSLSGSFHWDTVPRVPMGIFFEWTDGPARTRWGSRLGYELGVRVGPHAELRAQLSYQGRTAIEGALGGGGGLAWSF